MKAVESQAQIMTDTLSRKAIGMATLSGHWTKSETTEEIHAAWSPSGGMQVTLGPTSSRYTHNSIHTSSTNGQGNINIKLKKKKFKQHTNPT